MPARVTINASRFQRLLTAVGGPGERLLRRKAERVAELARGYAAGHGSIPEGIIVGPYRDGAIDVISTNPHTVLVHNGSRRHPIFPRRRGGMLRFQVGGRIVYARMVNHPGYRGDPFMTKALRDAG
ncbi:tail assembly chaperone [Streptomyces phage Xkcd426]|nr:tail assembly chaperone [Streptomyces phage Xkcd426]